MGRPKSPARGPLQVKLLRVLQEHTFTRVGESQERRAEARILAATNVDSSGRWRKAASARTWRSMPG